jgi:arylsulfatase A-like enzyme
LASRGWHTALLTDEVLLTELPGADDFAERVVVEHRPAKRLASDVDDTALARIFAAATQWLDAPREPFCLWVHAQAMRGPWDAPYELRRQYADEEDPPPPNFVAPPELRLPTEYDPDELLGITHAYCGQVALLDHCLGQLAGRLDIPPLAERTQLTVLGARGFPLGEHLRVGNCDAALYNELVQMPWIVRFPEGLGRLNRSQALVRPADLGGTLLDWLAIDRCEFAGGRFTSLLEVIRGERASVRDRLLLRSLHHRALRTPAWLLLESDDGPAELYAKPSDRWEVSEVANLCPEIVAGLQTALAESVAADVNEPTTPLAELLVTEVD